MSGYIEGLFLPKNKYSLHPIGTKTLRGTTQISVSARQPEVIDACAHSSALYRAPPGRAYCYWFDPAASRGFPRTRAAGLPPYSGSLCAQCRGHASFRQRRKTDVPHALPTHGCDFSNYTLFFRFVNAPSRDSTIILPFTNQNPFTFTG